jgi:threonyl-tRNA synthetase
MAIIGDKEMETQTISLRLPSGENKQGISLEVFVETLQKEINTRSLNSIF